jgi:hypothetical protein
VFHNASSQNLKSAQQTLRCAVTGKRNGSQNKQDLKRLSEDKISKGNLKPPLPQKCILKPLNPIICSLIING